MAVCFLLVMGASLIYGSDVLLRPGTKQALHYLSWMAPIFILPSLLQKRSHRALMLGAYLFSTMLLALGMGLLAWQPEMLPNAWHRLCLTHPQEKSVLLAITVFLWAILAVHVRPRWASLGAVFAAVFITVVLLLGQSERVGQVLWVVGLGFFALRHLRWRTIACGIILLGLAAAALMLNAPNRVTDNLHRTVVNTQAFITQPAVRTHPTTSMAIRLSLYAKSYPFFKAQPWFGYGAGTFTSTLPGYTLPDQLGPYSGPLENNYLMLLLAVGLTGLTCFILFLVALWRMGNTLPTLERSILQGTLLLIGLAAASFPAFTVYMTSLLLSITALTCLGASPVLSDKEG
jgi:O-antigen ligase